MGRMILLALSLAAIAASPADARQCRSSSQDAVRVQGAIQSFYDALAKDDRAAFERSVTRDFRAFEHGERFTAETLFKAIMVAPIGSSHQLAVERGDGARRLRHGAGNVGQPRVGRGAAEDRAAQLAGIGGYAALADRLADGVSPFDRPDRGKVNS